MSTLKQNEQDTFILEAASKWISRFASDDVTEKDRHDFQLWLEEDEHHQKVFDELRSIEIDLDAIGGFTELDSDVLTTELLIAHEEARDLQQQDKPLRSSLPASAMAGIAATISLVVIGLGIWITVLNTALSPEAVTYSTLVGEQEEMMLSDGSIVSLNTSSALSVAFTEEQRNIYLTNGEAYFQVAKDPDRPFVVYAGNDVVEAVGTSFTVYHRDDVLRVSVVEGTVAFGGTPGQGMHDIYRQDDTGTVLAQRIDGGQSMTYLDGQEQARVYEDSRIEHAASWRQGKLYFESTPLTEIIKEVSYYIPQRIVIVDQNIATYRGSGVFRVDNAEAIVKAFEAAWPVRIVQQSPDLVLLYSAN